MDPGINSVYGKRLRVRVCGLHWHEDKLLMVRHGRLASGDLWAPPGGGLEFGESVGDCLQKEFREETGLHVAAGRFLFGCEFIQDPLHAIELYFEVSATGGRLIKGSDPELPIIKEVKFMTAGEIAAIPRGSLHGIFRLVPTAKQLNMLNGFFRI